MKDSMQMKYPLNIVFTDIQHHDIDKFLLVRVAKIQLLGTKIHYTKFQRIQGVENEVLARKISQKIKDSTDEISFK